MAPPCPGRVHQLIPGFAVGYAWLAPSAATPSSRNCPASLSGMYIPAHFAAEDLVAVAAFVDRVGAADLITFDGSRPVATLLPIIWERPPDAREPAGSDGPVAFGRLLGHIALKNPQWCTAIAAIPG